MKGNFMKRLCACLIFQWLFLDQISFETTEVDFNFIFISIEKIFWKYPKYFGKNPGTNRNIIAHVL